MSERRHPRAFSLDDRLVYDAYIAGRMSAALAAGVRAGLFELLEDRGPLSSEEIARALGFGERSTRALLAALVAMRLLRRDDSRTSGTSAVSGAPDRISLSPEAAAYLVRGKPGWLGGLIDLEVESFLSPAALLEALRKGTATVYGDADPWEAHEVDPELARRFTRGMHSVSERPAAGLAEVVDLSRTSRLLDVGGGSGALSIALARANPRLECVIWDLGVVCEITREFVREADVGSGDLVRRVTASPGNMFRDPFPSGFDAILLSQILHDWTFEKGRVLLAKAAAALEPGGLLLIHEKLVDEDGSGPLANALVHLDMLVWTEGQQFTFEELRTMLEEAGFEGIELRATAGYWSVVLARRV